MHMQGALEQAQTDKTQLEAEFKKASEAAAADRASVLERLRHEYNSQEQTMKDKIQQQIHAAEKLYKVTLYYCKMLHGCRLTTTPWHTKTMDRQTLLP